MEIDSFIKNNHKCRMRNRMSNHHFSFLIPHSSFLIILCLSGEILEASWR